MKTLSYLKYSIILLILALFASQSQAQARKFGGNGKFKELRSQMKEWGIKSILPEVQNFRKEVESSLSAGDIEKLSKLRTNAKDLNKELINRRISALEAMRDRNKSTMKSAREGIADIRKEQMDLLKELKSLMTPYTEKLKSIGAKYTPKIKSMTEDAKKIGKEWYEKNKSNLTDKEKAFLKKWMAKRGEGSKFQEMKKKMRLVRILLWDGQTDLL